MKSRPSYALAALLAAGMLTIQPAGAATATVSCTISSNQSTTYTATGAVASPGDLAGDCLAGGAGNINGSDNDGFLAAYADEGYLTLAKLDHSAGSDLLGFQVEGNSNESQSGTWSVTQALLDKYDSLALGLKAGNSWAVILLEDGLQSGTWFTSRGISHINLYGVLAPPPPTTAVPGPLAGAGLPALLALGGFVWARRRKAAA